jgi:hypothetical protein
VTLVLQQKSLSKAALTVFGIFILISILTAPLVQADPVITVPKTCNVGNEFSLTGHGFPANTAVTILLGRTTIDVKKSDLNGDLFISRLFVPIIFSTGEFNVSATVDSQILAYAPITILEYVPPTPTPTPTLQPSPSPTESSSTEPTYTDDTGGNTDPYSFDDETASPNPTDNSGILTVAVAAVLIAVLVPVTILYFRGSVGGRGRRNRDFRNQDPYFQQNGAFGPYGQPYQNRPYGQANYGRSSVGTRICPNCRQVVGGNLAFCPYCSRKMN